VANKQSDSIKKRFWPLINENFFAGKRILVAGGGGFVGTHLTKKLISLGANVRSTYHSKDLQEKIEGVEYVKVDLLDSGDCAKVTKDVDFVFMCAANSSGAEVMDKTPLIHLTPNVVMNSQMLSAAYENQVNKFCFISSNTVYPLTDFAVREDDVTGEFFDKYFIVGWMKRFSEIMCEMYATKIKRPMDIVIVRPGNLYGPFDKFNKSESKVVAALIRRAVEKQNPFEVWGDGLDLKDFLYIEDFIEGMLKAFELNQKFAIFNVASGIPITIKEILQKILESAGHSQVKVIFDSTKPTMIPIRLIDISSIIEATGWAPKTEVGDGLRQTIDWYIEFFKTHNPEGMPNDNL
jgi:GDP-L-fucose synthase